jgi:hypothetical protein
MEAGMNQRHALGNLIVALGPVLLGLLFAGVGLFMRKYPGVIYLLLPGALYLAGLVLFLRAKASVIRSGQLVSFGSARMGALEQRHYRIGYGLMGLATLSALVLLASARALP